LQDAAPCSGELLSAIEAKWGSLDKFITTFNAKTAAVQVPLLCLTST
jgi:superoxide dismutase